jgi:osmotically-inducible protein OsmY
MTKTALSSYASPQTASTAKAYSDRGASRRSGIARTLTLCAVLAGTALSSGCALLMAGGIVGGSMVAVDRRTSGTQLDDQSIELKAQNRVKESIGDRGHVSVTSYGRLLLVTGEVPTEADKAAVAQNVARIDNVRSIVNELAVMPNTGIGSRSSDTITTAKVKATLVDAKDLVANAFKVVTERGTVYLMGRVTEREATRAVNLVRTISGVTKVVRVFEVVSEQDLANNVQPK